jgi:hypothetical protein
LKNKKEKKKEKKFICFGHVSQSEKKNQKSQNQPIFVGFFRSLGFLIASDSEV